MIFYCTGLYDHSHIGEGGGAGGGGGGRGGAGRVTQNHTKNRSKDTIDGSRHGIVTSEVTMPVCVQMFVKHPEVQTES